MYWVTTDSNELVLLKGLAANDRKAIETIYRVHYSMIQTLVINNNGTSDDARDIFQEAIIVYTKRPSPGVLSCTHN
ncbi:MAG: hypothetical protein WDM78_04070 [Puia sp.]